MKLIYSVFSGTYYEVLEKDIKILDIGQIPLKEKPPNSCKKCNGRGYIGRDIKNYAYEVCNCVRKKIDFDYIKTLMPNNTDLTNK
jgi:hypothetical protein